VLRRILNELKTIDEEAERAPILRHEAAIALAYTAFGLLALHYLKLHSSLQTLLSTLDAWFGRPAGSLLRELHDTGYLGLISQAWWGAWHALIYLLIPILIIRYRHRQPLTRYGLCWGDTRHWAGWYVVLATPIVVFALLASQRADFLNHYPFYKLAGRSWFDLISWELIYLSQFFALEFFFRGYLLHALKPRFGALAIAVMVIPYTMIHFPKPWLEATGAIAFGFFLGLLALRSRSMIGGFAVHAIVALSMDLFALARTDRLPAAFWPPG
jgi:membrane protease YdiL (CAAX protease family)